MVDRVPTKIMIRPEPEQERGPLWAAVFIVGLCISGCGGRSYLVDPFDPTPVVDRAETQTEGNIRVSAAVLGESETEAIFGLSLYDQGIQPVWLEVENSGPAIARYAPVSTDRIYFTPNEIAYKNRGGYSDTARTAMESRFLELEMPRYIDPGETRSGFVFTHVREGTKGFNVDVFTNSEVHSFTFLIRVPGFVPDYADLNPDGLYSSEEMSVVDMEGLRRAVGELPCCTADASGNSTGNPVNLVIVGKAADVLTALLRANWQETSADSVEDDGNYMFGRARDAEFRHSNPKTRDYYTMRLWKAPIDLGDLHVAVAQVEHKIYAGNVVLRSDPDADSARFFALQNIWYAQSLQQVAWVAGGEIVPVDSVWTNLFETNYFTDGYRAVIWLSEDLLSPHETVALDWDEPPELAR